MAENVTLAPVTSFTNDSSAVATVNANFQLIESAFEDCLSLQGLSPNQMQAVLDMNSFNIINIPPPATVNSPVRLSDVISTSVALTVPPVGTSGSTVPLLNGLNTWSAAQLLNVSGLSSGSVTPGSRGPFMVWSNPSSITAAGQSGCMQLWMGDNPTATPGANSPVALTISALNGNGRGGGAGSQGIWGININVGQANLGAGYVQSPLQGLEIDMYSDVGFVQAINPFQANWVTCLQLYNSPAVAPITNAITIWSASVNNSAWMYEGISISRCINFGVRFYTAPGDVSSAFGQAAIYDGSNSATILKSDTTHTTGIDFSSATFTTAIKTPGFTLDGSGNLSAVKLTVTPSSGNAQMLVVSPDTTHQSTLTFYEVATPYWQLGKDVTANNKQFFIFDVVLGQSLIKSASNSGLIQFGATNSFSATASVATALTSVGPVGASTTVQTWLTIKDSAGITRYIPCF
jgi:hypothetical protein